MTVKRSKNDSRAHIYTVSVKAGEKSNIVYTVVMLRPDHFGPTKGSMRLAKVRCKTRETGHGIFIFAKRCTYTRCSFRPGHIVFKSSFVTGNVRGSDAKSRKVKHTRNGRGSAVFRTPPAVTVIFAKRSYDRLPCGRDGGISVSGVRFSGNEKVNGLERRI